MAEGRPIKLVITQQADYRAPANGGGGKKPFGEVDIEFRMELCRQLDSVFNYFSSGFQKFPEVPVVAKVKLIEKATAKSHRPNHIFSHGLSPIIQAPMPDLLYISLTKRVFEELRSKILTDHSKEGIHNISTIESILPYKKEDAISPNFTPKSNYKEPIKVKLFDHKNNDSNSKLMEGFYECIKNLNNSAINVEQLDYGIEPIFKLSNYKKTEVEILAGFMGVQSLSPFPNYICSLTSPDSIAPRIPTIPAPKHGVSYPVVGLLDSGMTDSIKSINPWIKKQLRRYPAGYSDYSHGTFVGGLLSCGSVFNNDPRIPNVPCKIVDVQAISSDTGGTKEYEIKGAIETAMHDYPEVRIWNLSFGSDEPCNQNQFSDFGIYLDNLQKTYDKIFVISAGNYDQAPLRKWPTQFTHSNDRISPPADSVMAVCVGAIANKQSPISAVKIDEPSPFSRRGPGPSYLPKPEVVHYGGNSCINGSISNLGIHSITQLGGLAEHSGTSYSTPLIASSLAHLDYSLDGQASRPLLKALLVHSARINPNLPGDQDKNYFGNGLPGDIDSLFDCKPWESTIIFQANLIERTHFSKPYFPIPDCLLKEGKFKGEIFMTVVYEPPLDGTRGSAEYVCSHVDASLGRYEVSAKGNPCFKTLVPEERKIGTATAESTLVREGQKWAPIRTYYRNATKGIDAAIWGLDVHLICRNLFLLEEPVPAVIVVTIRDIDKTADVYEGVDLKLKTNGWITQDLQLQNISRLRN